MVMGMLFVMTQVTMSSYRQQSDDGPLYGVKHSEPSLVQALNSHLAAGNSVAGQGLLQIAGMLGNSYFIGSATAQATGARPGKSHIPGSHPM